MQRHNLFRRATVKPKIFTFEEGNFPQLIQGKNENENEDQIREKYKDIAAKEVPTTIHTSVSILPKGWVDYGKGEEQRKGEQYEGKEDQYEEKEEKEREKEKEIELCCSILEKNRERYKAYYDSLYGEGEYDRVFFYGGNDEDDHDWNEFNGYE